MKLWLFGTYKWQGNPKALMLYMQKKYADTHELWWIADKQEDVAHISNLGLNAALMGTKKANGLFANADVYVTENFRESYPESLNSDAVVFNLWHGVGLKHVELGLDADVDVAESIVRKWTRNYSLFKNNVRFLTTSQAMENHFIEDMKLSPSQIVRGSYPRNSVYKKKNSDLYKTLAVQGYNLEEFSDVYAFVPTYRNFKKTQGEFKKLIPDLDALVTKMQAENSLLIVKLHPQMKSDESFVKAQADFAGNTNVLFWDDEYDIYEIFPYITVGIVDYSSIFYDLLESGVDKYIRYVPDYEEYVSGRELIGDYFELTDGVIANSFQELLSNVTQNLPVIERKDFLLDYFFGFGGESSLDDLIKQIDGTKVEKIEYPELHTFDIFDTLIRRDTLAPKSIFAKISQQMNDSDLNFETYLVRKYPVIRNQVENDLRDAFKKTTFERETDKIEVTLDDILHRLAENFNLTDAQQDFLYKAEVDAEIEAVEPIVSRINEVFELIDNGNEVLLITDMYLPRNVIESMLKKADPRLLNLTMYLSNEVGHMKANAKLFTNVFFDLDYHYSKWVHHGDNKRSDGIIPRRMGIETVNHDMDTFLPYEALFVDNAEWDMKYDMFKIATMMQRFRESVRYDDETEFDKAAYYAYSYIGTAFVPYINWVLKDAIKRGYETVYFISRDGYYMKQIADALIETAGLSIKAEFIYGSRKAWRVPSFIEEVDPASFTPFGMFASMESFDDLVASSQLTEEELLSIIPEIEGYRDEPTLKGDVAVGIRDLFNKSDKYKERLLQISAERRPIVLDYLRQVINFDQKFAFVEFWGRGYTQDTFTRLLQAASGTKLKNPFYYVRNYTDNIGDSVRHRFTQMPKNFNGFEPIFATTPYKSIPGYEYAEDGTVKPIFTPQWNEFHETITKGIQKFAHDYAALNLRDADRVDRYVAETAYEYFFSTPNDQFISEVFANYKYNEAMYGEVHEFAPELTPEDVMRHSIEELKEMTKNLEISLTRSSDATREAFKLRQKVEKNFNEKAEKTTKVFPVNDLSKYVAPGRFPAEVVLLKDQHSYASVKWANNAKSKTLLRKDALIDVIGVEWTANGVPRLRTKNSGYISANVNEVTIPREDIENYVYKNVTKVLVLSPTYVYTSSSFERHNRTEMKLKRGQIIDVKAVEWTKGGTPRLKITDGYITANRNFVTQDISRVGALGKKALKGVVKRIVK